MQSSRSKWVIAAVVAVAVAGGAGLLVAVGGGDDGTDRPAEAGTAPGMLVYRSPACGCCAEWVEHMREAGFEVRVEDRTDLASVKAELGVPVDLSSCHTARVGDYVIEGHVPAADVRRLLAERPDVKGLAVPGMPAGSPGMEGPNPEPYSVVAFDGDGGREVFARH